MSDFVDFNKRSIDLPPGCKDLNDVLADGRKRTKAGVAACSGAGWTQYIGKSASGKSVYREVAAGTAADLEKYSARIFETRDNSTAVEISLQEKPIIARIYKMTDGTIKASAEYEAREDLDRAMRSFLERYDLLKPPRASIDSPDPGNFFPDVPVYILCDPRAYALKRGANDRGS